MSTTKRSTIWYCVICIIPLTAAYFNSYIFAQQWPASFCFEDGRNRGHDECDLATNITTWTVHGLWPSVVDNRLTDCNKSWHLYLRDIRPLVDEMRARWPSFRSSDFSFWKHEWTEHGTCAEMVPELRGPYNFFKKALQLNKQYDLLNYFKSHGISPDEKKCYAYADFRNASQQFFNESVAFSCTRDSRTSRQHLAEVKLCFSKDFKLACDLPGQQKTRQFSRKGMPEAEQCSQHEPICYAPIPHLAKPMAADNW